MKKFLIALVTAVFLAPTSVGAQRPKDVNFPFGYSKVDDADTVFLTGYGCTKASMSLRVYNLVNYGEGGYGSNRRPMNVSNAIAKVERERRDGDCITVFAEQAILVQVGIEEDFMGNNVIVRIYKVRGYDGAYFVVFNK